MRYFYINIVVLLLAIYCCGIAVFINNDLWNDEIYTLCFL